MNKTKHFKRLWGLMLLLIAMLMPQGAWAANHYDAGYESTATTYSAAGIKFKITAVRMYNYQGNNSHFNSNPVVTITAGGHTHTFNLGSLTGESGNSIFYYNGEGNENPYKGSGSFSKRTYEQTVDGIPVKAYFDNQKNEQRVSTNPDKTYKDNGDGSSKWCTADLTIEIGVQTAATVTIAGNWRDESDGINTTESYSWPFSIPKHTCNSDIQSDTYRKSAATCTDAAVYYKSCSWCGAAQSGTFTSGSALGHGSTGYTESYVWTGNTYNDASKDTKACTFTLTCKKCSTKVVNGASLTCIKTAHVDATCTATGSTTYQATGSYTAANSDYNYSATKTNVYTVAALGHGTTGFTESYSWTGNAYNNPSQDTKACTFTLTCKKCSTKVVNGASLTCTMWSHVNATCRATGSTTYRATGSYTAANSDYNYSSTNTNVYTIAALGHSYGAGSWSWADDGHSATCTRTCDRTNCYTNIPGHTSSKSVTLGNGITSEQQVAPTCITQGTTRYTATATVENVEYRDTKDIKDIPATGLHTFDDVTDPHHTLCTVCDHSFLRYTSSTKKAVDPYDANELKGANGAKLDFTNTYVDGQGVMEFKGTLKTIGDYAFLNCSGFTGNLTIPNSVTSIGRSAFLRCSGFTGNLTIPNSVTSIGDYAFEKCSGLKGNLTIPNSVTSIGASAFNNCSGFTGNLTIPNSVTSIGGYAFYECYSFNGNLTIPNSVTSIGDYAFSGCRGFIGDLTIPNSVTSIESSAFEGCFRFNGNLTIANSVTSIGDYAFSGCSGFTGVEFQSVPQIGGSRTFDNVTNNKTVVLSDNSYVYKGDNPYFPAVQSATYTRTGIKNQWGTIVVPFDVNGSGADYDLYKLDQVYDFELTLTKVNGTLAAGTPALIRLHDDLDGDYSLTLTASNTTVSGQLNDGSEANGLQLVGTYETQELNDYDYFISNNKFWRVGDMGYIRAYGVKVAPFRAYLHSTAAGAKAGSLRISIENDNTTTAVKTLNAIIEGDAEYYDLNGRKLNSLQKGVNIVKMSNGKTIKVNIK